MDRKHSSAEQLGFYDDSFDSPTSESELIEHTYESGMSPDHQSIRLEGRDLVELYEVCFRLSLLSSAFESSLIVLFHFAFSLSLFNSLAFVHLYLHLRLRFGGAEPVNREQC